MARAFTTVVLLLTIVSLVSACQSMTGKSAGTNVDDAAITASVKTKLVADKPTNLTRVDVDTNRGTVYLTGAVDSVEQRARAEQLAWQASGVKAVVNNLQVSKR
jgi:hyperosmotically inducible periplasmic protein